MISVELQILLATALSIAFVHTLTGPDHYVPIVALARSRGWSLGRMLWWTAACGCGHVWSSALLGGLGALGGWSLSALTTLQQWRGGLAGWCLFASGLVYLIWLQFPAGRRRSHAHFEPGADGGIVVYAHRHGQAVAPNNRRRLTPYILFVIFVLGPSEPMIPLLFAPGLKGSWAGVILLIACYTTATLATMVVMVLLVHFGAASRLRTWDRLGSHLSAMALVICGAGMLWLGW
jgi:hypothetical protein